MINNLILVALMITIVGCSGGSGGSSGTATSSNKFTESGSIVTIDAITSSTRQSIQAMVGSQTYYGRVLYINGSNLYAASIHFDLNKNNDSTAYFSNFMIDRLVQVTAYNSVSAIVTSSTNTNVTASFNSTSNSLTIANATSRFVNFNVDFGNNTHFGDVTNAGVIFSSDFSTMVGGNNSTFFFLAQKASSLSSVSITDLQTNWGLANFSVNGSGTINISSTSTAIVSGIGGNGLTAFRGTSSSGGSFQGETTLTDSGTGVFMLGFDTAGNATPTADGTIDGVFLLSPDKQFVLGYNLYDGIYFAGSK